MTSAAAASTWSRPATIDAFYATERPRVIAHRGFSARAPENTLVAVEQAIEIGADMVEVDVLLSRDGEVVVIHDETVDRTTDGRGRVAGMDLEELRRLDAGSWFDASFAGTRIPTFAEVLNATRGRILLNVEIKTEAVTDEARGGIAHRVVDLVRASGMVDEVVTSSFDPRALAHVQELAPEIHRASLYAKELHHGQPPSDIAGRVGARAYNVGSKYLTDAMLADCAAAGLPVSVYTVNEPAEMEKLLARGVVALFTDEPAAMIDLLR